MVPIEVMLKRLTRFKKVWKLGLKSNCIWVIIVSYENLFVILARALGDSARSISSSSGKPICIYLWLLFRQMTARWVSLCIN